jgi:inverse autotransporter-like protein with beta domain
MISRIALSFALVLSGPIGAVAAEGDKWSSYADVEGKLGTDRNLGEVSLFVPLGQSHESLFFGNLISRIDDQDSFEGNVGLGYREIVDGSYIVGGYAYFDRRKSASDNYFNQITAGAELMTDVWTARTNVYFADNDLKPTSGGVVTQTGTQIFVQSNLEGALSGFDAEVGRVIPLGLDDVTLTGFAGGFHFDRSSFDNVSGPRARAELAFDNLWDGMLPSGTQLRFGAEVQHDDVRDTQGFLSARLRVPLFGGSSGSTLSGLDRRMVDPVVRDIDVVAGAGLSAPVAPVLASNGATIRSANVIDADDDLGVALTAAGPNSVIIVDGSKGAITSAGDADALTGQTIVGAQGAGLNLMDPNTGETIVWRPNGVRPTLSNVRLTLPGTNVATGLDFDGSYLTVATTEPLPLAPLILVPLDPVSDFSLSDLSFGGTYNLNNPMATTLGGLLTISNATNVDINSLRFADFSIVAAGGAYMSAISSIASTNIRINDVSVTNGSLVSGGSTARFAGLSADLGANSIAVSNFHVDGLTATSTGMPLVVPGGGFAVLLGGSPGANANGMFVEGNSTVSVRDSSFRNLTASNAVGAANATGVSALGSTSIALSNVQIGGLAEAGTDANATVGIDLGRGAGIILGSGAAILEMQGVSLGGLTNSIEFNKQPSPILMVPTTSSATLSGSGNVLGAGVGGCVNNAPADVTVTGSISFTNGTTCP